MPLPCAWMETAQRLPPLPASEQCSVTACATQPNWGCWTPIPSTGSPDVPPSQRAWPMPGPFPGPLKCRRSWPRSPGCAQSLPRSSAASTTPRCARPKPSRCMPVTATCHPQAGASSPAPDPCPAQPAPGPPTAPPTNHAVSSTAPTGSPEWCRSRRSLSACCATTSRYMGALRTGGCSAAPAAARSARASTAAPGTRLSPPPCLDRQPSRRCAPTTCVTPRCRYGWLPAPHPPTLPPAPGTASTSCWPPTPTACPVTARLPPRTSTGLCMPAAHRWPTHPGITQPDRVRHASVPQLDPTGHHGT